MADVLVRDMLKLDDIDRGLIHALHIDGRAPFSRIATVLGVSTQTVARRYRRLREAAGLRVVGLPNPHQAAQTQWLVRLTATPAAAQTLARSLARRPDTSWVKLTSGGTEIVTIVHTSADADTAHSMLLHDVPRTTGVTSVSAHLMLHVYLGGPTAWHGRLNALDERQQRLLRPGRTVRAEGGSLAPADQVLCDVLGHDGRTGYADLAAATGWSAATVARRLDDLRAHGVIFFDVEVDDGLLGITTQAMLWMSVAPARLDDVGATMAGHEELAVVAATTGSTNLMAQALCADPAGLHRYLTRRLGALDGIRSVETAPVLRTVKAAGPVLPVR